MGEIYFTSDLHIGHDKDFLWGPRGFSSSKEHDEAIIENWNKTIHKNDIVYVLGDLMMGSNHQYALDCFSSLNGKIAFALGNHDTINKANVYNQCTTFDQLALMDGNMYANIIKSGKWSFYISHYPTMLADLFAGKKEPRLICLHGHTHSKDKFQYLQHCCYNVALDAHNNMPVNIETIKNDLSEKIRTLRDDFQKANKE